MMTERIAPSAEGRRIVICDYNALLLSVTGLLRMSGYAVFQAHDGWAARELCILLPNIELLVLNTYGTGIDVAELCGNIRSIKPGMPVLHIGSSVPKGLPADVPTLPEDFNADGLLSAVAALIEPGQMRQAPVELRSRGKTLSYPNGRRREDGGSRPVEPLSPLLPTAVALGPSSTSPYP